MQTISPTPDRDPHPVDRDAVIESSDAIPLAHYVLALRRYRSVIAFSFIAVVLAYTIIALVFYITAPGQRTTAQPFRLDFEGAGEGRYPNGSRFNVADVINGPILERVHRDNKLEGVISFGDFSRSLFVLESNREYDALASQYTAQLADPHLSAVDRERLQREFELKRQSISKNEYALNFTRPLGMKRIPETTVRKVLTEVLSDWADFAVHQQHVISYDISVLSPNIVAPNPNDKDPVLTLESLRSTANRVIANAIAMKRLPGATLTRTKDGLSLEELHLRVEQLTRFRLEPMIISTIHANRSAEERAATTRFLENQLAYDQRQVEAAQRKVDALRDSIAAYEQPASEPTAQRAAAPQPQPQPRLGAQGESVTTQLNDTFIDRLMSLSGRAADVDFRQRRANEYQIAIEATIAPQQAVAWDTQILAEMRRPGSSTGATTAEIESARAELSSLITKVNDLLQAISNNMTPSAQLFTVTGPPSTTRVHSVNGSRLLLYGVLLSLLSLPVVALGCLLHDRIREEEAIEESHGHVR